MILTSGTVTGFDDEVFDDEVKLAKIIELSERFVFFEAGVPYSSCRMGTPRYPTVERIKEFITKCPGVPKSLHVSRRGLTDFIEGDADIMHCVDAFTRVQLNFGSDFDVNAQEMAIVRERIAARPNKPFIFPLNDETKHLLPFLAGLPNLQILFDASGGKGLSARELPRPLQGYQDNCGWAGGFGPGNISAKLDELVGITRPNERVWFDAEGKIRINNRLDFDIAHDFLGKVEFQLCHTPRSDTGLLVFKRPLFWTKPIPPLKLAA